jgi:dihydroneopterin aldolase
VTFSACFCSGFGIFKVCAIDAAMNLSDRNTQHDLSVHSLRLEELSVQVHLGCTGEERVNSQEVRLTVELRFHKAPLGAHSDALADTVCYAEISEALTSRLEAVEYNLIERLAYDAFAIAKDIASSKVDVGIIVHKVRPPVANLNGGAWFRCGDFLA